jgi:PTS system nitrogen regulatory IIA component
VVPAYQINGQYRFHQPELLEWAAARRKKVSVDILAEPAGDEAACVGIAEALENGSICYRVEGRDSASALRAVVKLMRLPEEVDRGFLLRALLAREALGSTAVGDGIAIPHVRSPIVRHVRRPSITLCFLEHSIDFGALDCRPVRALFTVLSPTIRAHLHLMLHLAFALRDAAFQDAIQREASREEILREARRVEALLVRLQADRPR